MAVVTLLSDFVDGSSMALAEDTDAPTLNDYMTGSQGRLWAGVQQRRRQRGRSQRPISVSPTAVGSSQPPHWKLVG